MAYLAMRASISRPMKLATKIMTVSFSIDFHLKSIERLTSIDSPLALESPCRSVSGSASGPRFVRRVSIKFVLLLFRPNEYFTTTYLIRSHCIRRARHAGPSSGGRAACIWRL